MAVHDFEKCYLCLTWKERDFMTDDHIPPKSFFPKPRPTDLITVRCCKACNNKYSMDDEAFRAWVAAAGFNSEAGKRIWSEVLSGSLKRSPKLRENMLKKLKAATMKTPDGRDAEVGLLGFPHKRGDRFLARIAKGLLRKFHPDYDYSYDDFVVYMLTEQTANILRQLNLRFTTGSRGKDVFRFGYCFTNERNSGAWLFEFYGTTSMIVMHSAGFGEGGPFLDG